MAITYTIVHIIVDYRSSFRVELWMLTSMPRLDASRPDASLSHCSIPDGTLVKFDFRNLGLGGCDAARRRIVECVPYARKVSTEMVEGTQNGKCSQIKFWRCCQCSLLFWKIRPVDQTTLHASNTAHVPTYSYHIMSHRARVYLRNIFIHNAPDTQRDLCDRLWWCWCCHGESNEEMSFMGAFRVLKKDASNQSTLSTPKFGWIVMGPCIHWNSVMNLWLHPKATMSTLIRKHSNALTVCRFDPGYRWVVSWWRVMITRNMQSGNQWVL